MTQIHLRIASSADWPDRLWETGFRAGGLKQLQLSPGAPTKLRVNASHRLQAGPERMMTRR
jgi:hypothetical protein